MPGVCVRVRWLHACVCQAPIHKHEQVTPEPPEPPVSQGTVRAADSRLGLGSCSG